MTARLFLAAWDAGEIDFDDPDKHSAYVGIWMLLPFVRPEVEE